MVIKSAGFIAVIKFVDRGLRNFSEKSYKQKSLKKKGQKLKTQNSYIFCIYLQFRSILDYICT
jgi:hypothetical protein